MSHHWEVLLDVARRSREYLERIGERRVFPSNEAITALANLDVPLQDQPLAPAAVIEELDRWGAPAATAIAGPRYFGFVNGGALPAALAVHWLASAWEQNGAFREMSHTSSKRSLAAGCWISSTCRASRRWDS
jgi:hypothetical protein